MLGANLARVVLNPELRLALSSRGREVATQFRVAGVADRLETFLAQRRQSRH